MLASLGKVFAVIIVSGLLFVGILDNIKGSPNLDAIRENILTKAYMDKTKGEYATCYYSINSSQGAISDVSLSYYHPGMSEAEIAKIKQVEDDFVRKVKDQCEALVKEYEESYELYKKSSDHIAVAGRSLFDNLVNVEPEKDRSVIEYEPAFVRLKSGSPFDNYIFTDEDIRQHFVHGMGY